MKKPNIKLGEMGTWKRGGNGRFRTFDGFIDDVWQIEWSEDGECIAEIVHGKENAQAISAVPEMIDALMEIVDNHTVQTTSDMRRYKKAKQALEKAGVQL